jgi:hypothetical protein
MRAILICLLGVMIVGCGDGREEGRAKIRQQIIDRHRGETLWDDIVPPLLDFVEGKNQSWAVIDVELEGNREQIFLLYKQVRYMDRDWSFRVMVERFNPQSRETIGTENKVVSACGRLDDLLWRME